MDFITNILADEAVQTAILAIIGAALTFFLNRFTGALQAATGIKIDQRASEAFHSAIMTGVESALDRGLKEGTSAFKQHVIAHVTQSSGESFARMSPLPDVLDNLIVRYTRQSLAKYGKLG